MKKRLICIITVLMMCISSFGTMQVLADGSELSYEQAEETCERMVWYYDCGNYLEAIAVADDLLQNYIVDDWHRQVASDYRYMAQYCYEEYLKKSQRYTYRISDWGMNITYRGDMIPESNYNGVSFSLPYEDAYISVSSVQVGSWGAGSPEEYVRSWGYFGDGYAYRGGYGRAYAMLSSNYVNVAGFTAYQFSYRITHFADKYLSDGTYSLDRRIAFQYGDWIYVIQMEQSGEYIWSDDFWDAMETVINGISFS